MSAGGGAGQVSGRRLIVSDPAPAVLRRAVVSTRRPGFAACDPSGPGRFELLFRLWLDSRAPGPDQQAVQAQVSSATRSGSIPARESAVRRRSRHIVAVAGTAALAAGLAGAGPAGAVPSITGTDGDVWNAASPATTYVLTAQSPGARITWELEGPGGGGGSGPGGPGRSGDGRSPITVSLPGLGDGTFRLAARERGLFGGRAARAFLVDRTAPTIAISRPLDGSSVAQGGSLLAAYACDGATSCAGTVPSGAGLDTTSPGAGSCA